MAVLAAAAGVVLWLLVALGHRTGVGSLGPAVARVRLPAYTRLVWSDEFSGAAGSAPSPASWRHDIGAWGSPDHELQTYTASTANAALDGDGHLVITARREAATGPDGLRRRYTSARLQTQGLVSERYGLIEARMQVPPGTGLWSAFWLMGDNFPRVGWPGSGELDVVEVIGRRPDTAHAALHGPAGTGGYQLFRDLLTPTALSAAFHTYAISWSPGSITWLLDGVPYATATPADLKPGETWVFERPFHLLLNLAVGGDFSGPPDATTPFPARLLIDWVRVYR